MKWHPLEMRWTGHRNMTHAHAVRPHPAHWFQAHPTVTALLLAALIVLVLIGLASMIGTNIQTETLSN